MSKALFDAIRTIKGSALTQADVDLINAVQSGSPASAVHSLKNPAVFFLKVRNAFGAMTQGQIDGFNVLLDAMKEWPVSWAAYGLGTAWHETARTMQPIKEYGGDPYFKKRYDIQGENPALARRLGNVHPGDGVKYAGRGYVQITGRDNFRKYGLEDNPDKALEVETAAHILVDGLESGRFTGKKLSDYLPADYVNARRCVNGLDQAQKIAGYAREFESALTDGGW